MKATLLTRSLSIVVLASALGVGIGVAYEPILGTIVGVVLVLTLYAFMFPELVAWLGLMSLAISPQYLVSQEVVAGLELTSLHKLVVLLALVPYVLLYGLREKMNAPIVAYLIVLFLTFTLSSWHPSLEVSQVFRAFIGFTMGWLVFSINWESRRARKYLLTLSLMPIISVAVGAILHALGTYQLYVMEYTGALRLQGANIPAHLAMLAFVGLGSAVVLVTRSNNWYLLLVVANFAILVSSGTRGATVASLFILLGYIVGQVRHAFRGKTVPLVSLLIFLAIAGSVIYAYWPSIEARMANNPLEQGFNTSGRLVAWQFFLNEAMVNPWFGRGLGAGTIGAGTVTAFGEVASGFTAPHNEYLRLLVDGGFIGILLVLLAFAIVFARILRRIRPESRLYVGALLCGFAVYSFFDNTMSTPQFLVPFCWYLAVVYTLDTQDHVHVAEPSRRTNAMSNQSGLVGSGTRNTLL